MPDNEIVLKEYDRAVWHLERAVRVDEVKDIRDRAIAIKAYAKQAKNKDAEINAWKLRVRAERRLGEMVVNGKDDRAPVGRPEKRDSENPISKPTLEEMGINKSLATRVRSLAAMTEGVFGKFLIDGAKQVEVHAEQVAKKEAKPKVRKPKTQREFSCPHCGRPVFLKDGRLEK